MVRRLYPLLVFILLFAACKEKHEYKVDIVLEGDSMYRQVLNQPFIDPGAYGIDYMGKHIAAQADAAGLDVNKTGTYTITYAATDEFGNTATAERTVIVYNEAENLQGSWFFYRYPPGGSDPDTSYTETLTASTTVNRLFCFSRFGNYDNAPVQAHIQANQVIIDSLQYNVGPSHNISIWFYGSGVQMNNNRLEFNYGEIKNGATSLYKARVSRE